MILTTLSWYLPWKLRKKIHFSDVLSFFIEFFTLVLHDFVEKNVHFSRYCCSETFGAQFMSARHLFGEFHGSVTTVTLYIKSTSPIHENQWEIIPFLAILMRMRWKQNYIYLFFIPSILKENTSSIIRPKLFI